jgi:hypothetical protein
MGCIAREPFIHVELAADRGDGGFVRNRFVRFDDIETIGRFRRDHRNTDVYASVCRYVQADRDSDFICPLVIDIDCEGDRPRARKECLQACRLLHERLGIPYESLGLFFSGNKGFHVVVRREIFADPAGDELLTVGRWLAGRLARHGCPSIDQGIYDRARLLRLPNSIHGKTGLYKIPIEYKELADLGLEYVLDLAKVPRDFDSADLPGECPQAAGWITRTLDRIRQSEMKRSGRKSSSRPGDGWRMPPCVRRVEQAILPDGMRHELYFALARFYAITGMAVDEAVTRIRQIDLRNPIRDPDYIARAVRNGWKYPGVSRCRESHLRLFCDPGACFRTDKE